MITKLLSILSGVSRLMQVLLGLALLVALVFFLSVLLASRTSQTASQPQWLSLQPLSPTPTATSQKTDTLAGWHLSRNPAFGYSIKYPPGWVASDITDSETSQAPSQNVTFRPDVPITYFSDIDKELFKR